MKLKNLFVIAIFTLAAVSCSKDDDKTDDTPKAKTPKITGHTESGLVGSTLVINGTDFGADIADNTVTLSGVTVTLSDANTTKLTGTVPEGAQTGKIKVTTAEGTATSTNDFIVTVEETNQVPTITEGQVFSVKEDIDDAFQIGSVEANDKDGDPLTFSITDEDNTLFKVTSDGQLSLLDGVSLDYETVTSHELTVEVDDGTDTAQEVITIEVQNVIDAPYALEESSFILKFETTTPNEEIGFGTDINLDYDFVVDWGDGTIEEIKTGGTMLHMFKEVGIHTVAISGKFPKIYFPNPFNIHVKSIEQWGTIEWKSFNGAFQECAYMEYNATDEPNLTNVTDLSFMFYKAYDFNGDIGDWDVSTITNMSYMFGNAESFDQNLGGWNITAVTNMSGMLSNSKLSMENYENTLIGWAGQTSVPGGIVLGATGLERCSEEADDAAGFLSNDLEWTIVDEGCGT
ncbi:BspA family leucine-rich repeat surface protein [Flagellimonas flava]|uniref:Cadherin domain-containing protein n=1 Tax=Flagellimonas flava TaxID=570519 RepID=A0A1M5Q1K0_9FLAO|nr:BspA family leucine-rich repeat surface protein [Allomuricauda flava]SHH07974.1 protein of unknown function, DUF285 [Allomuricauda flava]